LLATELQPTSKNILVCARENCRECDVYEKTVPNECPYAILHPLETRTGGRQVRGRQTGKTTELMSMAKDLDEFGYLVCYIAHTQQHLDRAKTMSGDNCGVRFVSIQQAYHDLRCMAPSIILADDITDGEMDHLKRLCGSRHLFFAHYLTPR
jgi:hypothetical protein